MTFGLNSHDRFFAMRDSLVGTGMPPSTIISPDLARDLAEETHGLRHLRFLHINSTANGGGVAEILRSLTPLMNNLGIDTEWLVINPPKEFYQVTKRIHNLLQGAEGTLSREELDVYSQSVREIVQQLRRSNILADVWILHDPQLLPLAQLMPKRPNETRIWVCHIDLTTPNRRVLDVLQPLMDAYDGLVFSLPAYVPSGLSTSSRVYIVPPAIDPLSEKNRPLDQTEASRVVAAMGVDPVRPLVTQVSRFDLWKDPWGVIDAFCQARSAVPGLQLALLGISQAADDPEGQEVWRSVKTRAAHDPDIHLYFDHSGLPASIDQIVNAFQVASTIIIQKSVREGFGLTVTEGMWKGKPVIGGNVGGIKAQIEDGETGYLVDSSEECGERIIQLINSPELRSQIGAAAKESVRKRFLMPRLALITFN